MERERIPYTSKVKPRFYKYISKNPVLANIQQLYTEVEVNRGEYLPSCYANIKGNNCFSIYHTDTKKLVYFFQLTKRSRKLISCHAIFSHRLLEGEYYLLFTSELAYQRAENTIRSRGYTVY